MIFNTHRHSGAVLWGVWGRENPPRTENHGFTWQIRDFRLSTWQMKCRWFSSNMPKAWYTSHIVCFVGLHRSHSCKRRILYFLRLQERCEFSLFMSCTNLVQANFGNALMCYFSFSKNTLLYKCSGELE